MAQPKRLSALARHKPKKKPYDYVLIVCEGEKTEPNYLSEMVRALQLSGTNIVVTGDCGSDPNSVVTEAIRRFEGDTTFDRVFCVFDRDGHANYHGAVERIREKALVRTEGKRKLGLAIFDAITSVPCFEYWILLHFQYTTAEMQRFADLEPRLRQVAQLRLYTKGMRGLYEVTAPHLQTALNNARLANQAAEQTGTDNPTTALPILVNYLQELASNRQ